MLSETPALNEKEDIMGATRGYYSLIQYCPDLSKAESVNVGVLLFCPEAKFIDARTSSENSRVRKFFGSGTFDSVRLQAAKKAIETRLRVCRDDFRTVDDLNHFIDTRANELLITAPRPMKVLNPAADLDALFKELVGGRAKKESRQPEFPELDRALREPRLANRIQFDQRVEIPVLGRTIEVPYTYRNGALNLIKPQKFPKSESNVKETASRLAIEGDLLFRHKAEDGAQRQLIVVSLTDQNHDRDREAWIRQILSEYNTRMVPQSQVDEFIHEVEKEAHD